MALTDSARSSGSSTGRLWQVASALKVGQLPVLVWLYIVTIALPIGFNIGPLSMSIMRVLLIVSIIPLLISLFSGKAGKIIPTDVLFILHMIWAALAIAVNNPSRAIENVGSTGIEFLGGYLLGRVMIRSPEQFLALCRAMFLLIILLLPFTIRENLSGNSFILETIRSIPGLDTFADVNMDKRMGLSRAQSVFAHPIHFGVFCSLMFSMAFVAFKGVISDFARYVFTAAVGLSTFLALSSGALLPVIIESGLIFYAYIMRNNRKKWHLLLAFCGFCYIVVDLLSNRTPIDVFLSYGTFSSHNAFWRRTIFEWGMINVRAHPIFGLGLNTWVRPYWMVSGSMDNFWLVMAVRYGVPGFLLLAIGYADLIRRTVKVKLDGDVGLQRIRLAMMFTFIGVTFSLSTVHIWTAVYSYMFFLFGSFVWITTATPRVAAGAVAADVPKADRAPTPYAREHLPANANVPPELPTTARRTDVSYARPARPNTTPEPPRTDEPRPDRQELKYSRFQQPSDPDDRSK